MIHLHPDAGLWQQAEMSSSYHSEAEATCLIGSEAVCSVPYAESQRVRGGDVTQQRGETEAN